MADKSYDQPRVSGGVPTGGAWAERPRVDGDVSLLSPAAAASLRMREAIAASSTASAEVVDRFVAGEFDRNPLVPPQELADITVYRASLRGSARSLLPESSRLYEHGWTPDRIEQMRSKIDFEPGDDQPFYNLLLVGVQPENVDRMIALGVPASSQYLRGLHEMDDAEVVSWAEFLRVNYAKRVPDDRFLWSDAATLKAAGVPADKATALRTIGFATEDILRIPGAASAELVADYATRSTLESRQVANLMSYNFHTGYNIPPEQAKLFGNDIPAGTIGRLIMLGADPETSRVAYAGEQETPLVM